MNRKGQNLMFAIITAAMIFIAGMLILNHLFDPVDIARTTGLGCSEANISDGTKLTCLGVNLIMPILIVVISGAAVGAILTRFFI